jgi:adenylylsulfate kinase-like enzyme
VRHTISEDLSQDGGYTADDRDREAQHIGIAFYKYAIYSVIVLVAVKSKFRQVPPDKPS